MPFGITRVHGTALTGASNNLTGVQSTFFSGYQPTFAVVQAVASKIDFTANLGSVGSALERLIIAMEQAGTVIGYGIPANAASSSTVVVMFDAGSLNQGDGVDGSGVSTGLTWLRTAASNGANAYNGNTNLAYTDIAITLNNGFTGSALSAS
jgi:hypothetical protein